MFTRRLPHLKVLWARHNELGWEGVTAIVSNLAELENIGIKDNEEVMPGAYVIGRLPNLRELLAGMKAPTQRIPDWLTGRQ